MKMACVEARDDRIDSLRTEKGMYRMASLYPFIPDCNDQNALALPIFNIGYYVWKLADAAAENASPKVTKTSIDIVRDNLRSLKQFSKAHSRARNFAETIEIELDKCCVAGRGAKRLVYSDVATIVRMGRSVATVRSANDEDLSRRWYLIGVNAATCDLQTPRTSIRQPLREVDTTFLNIAKTVVSTKEASKWLTTSVKSGSLLYDVIHGFLNAQVQGFWQPSSKKGVKSRFNGRELFDVEYDVMVLVFEAGSKGLNTKELTATYPSAANALGKLRKYPETKVYLSPKGNARFIAPAPRPPSN